MKICFLARPTFDRFSVAIYNKIRKSKDIEIKACFITSNQKESDFIRKEIDNAEIYETSQFIRDNWELGTREHLIELEKKYECAPIWKYIYSDRFLIHREYDYVVHITVGLFLFFEKIFSTGEVDFYYSEAIATLQCYVAYIVGKKYGVKYVSQMCARGSLDSLYHYFISDEFQHNKYFDENYKNIKYNKEEWKKADEYLKEFEEKDCPPPAMNMVSTMPKINIRFLINPILYLIRRFDRYQTDPCSYMYYQIYKTYLDPIVFYFNYNKVKKYYKKADYSQKYVYYPLHYQPEATTCVCAQKYENQLFYIDSFAKSLPADTLLYVKEHYALLGNRDPQFYKDLQKYPNVVMIDPWESSRKLIENAFAVTTLAGTAGLEAVLLRKPVILGGSIVYDNAPGVIKVDDIYQNYMELISNWKRPERDEVIQYLCACFRSYKKGNAYAQNFYDLIEDNIQDITDSLYDEMKNQLD